MFENCKDIDQLTKAIPKFIRDIEDNKDKVRPAMLAMANWKGRLRLAPGGQNYAELSSDYDRPPIPTQPTKNEKYKQAYLDACIKLVELGGQIPQTEADPYLGLLRIAGERPTESSKQKPIEQDEQKDNSKIAEWSKSLKSSQWAEIFECSKQTIRQRLNDQVYENERIDYRHWKIKIKDLPGEYILKYTKD